MLSKNKNLIIHCAKPTFVQFVYPVFLCALIFVMCAGVKLIVVESKSCARVKCAPHPGTCKHSKQAQIYRVISEWNVVNTA
jgi:hypothetical protein